MPLGLFVVVAGALLALGPARNTGYYPSLFYIPGFHLGTATRYFGADLLVLTFASGFVLVPGALLGIWLALTKPRARTESAFGDPRRPLHAALLLESVVYGDLGFIQERYLFDVLPLWTLAFLLYAQRKWPLEGRARRARGPDRAASLAMPLSKYAAGGGQAHSAFLFALSWLVGPTGSLGAASVLIAYAGGAAVVLLVGLAFRWPRLVTPYAIAFALVATTGASVAATRYDQSNASNIRSVVVGNDASWVDEAHVGKTTLLVAPGGRIPDAKLFWNTSLDRLLLIPGVQAARQLHVEHRRRRQQRRREGAGKPVTGPVMIDDWGTAMQLQKRRSSSGRSPARSTSRTAASGSASSPSASTPTAGSAAAAP